MRIAIKQSLCPFSHRPGTYCLIPNTTWEAQIFPTKALLRDLNSKQTAELKLPFGGAFEGFTVMQNLERGRIEVFSKRKKRVFLTKDSHPAIKGAELFLSKKRLSLGVHKKQDWDQVQRRRDLSELFPFLLRLADWIPEILLPQDPVGTMSLIDEGKWEAFFLAAFDGILSPRLSDPHFWGLIEEKSPPEEVSPIGLVHRAARAMEALFFQEKLMSWYLLPALPKAFHAGRFQSLTTQIGDQIDIEWSKKTLKKVIIRPKAPRAIHLVLQKKLKNFRLRTDLRKRGEIYSPKKPIELKQNQILYIDRFTS